MSAPNEVLLPGGLTRAQFEDFKDANPFAAAKYAQANGIVDARPNSGDAAVRLAALRPNGLAAAARGALSEALDVSTLATDDPRRVHAELQKTNPVIASRYAAEHNLNK